MNKGFSMIEMLIAIAIIAILGVVLYSNLYPARNQAMIASTTSEIAGLLRQAQSRSVTQASGTGWGVHFDNTNPTIPTYSLFSGNQYSSSTAAGTYQLAAGICFANIDPGTSTDVVFKQISGHPAGSLNLLLINCNSGSVSLWKATKPLPSPRDIAVGITSNSHIYVMGGNPYDGVTTTVVSAPINPDGSLGNWASVLPWPSNFQSSGKLVTAVAYGNHLYLTGMDYSNAARAYYTTINPTDGSLGGWVSTTPLSGGLTYGSGVAYRGYLYSLGGVQSSDGKATSSVFYNLINPTDGSLGGWVSTTALPIPIQAFFTFVSNNYLFAVGGIVNNGFSSSVYSAPINPDGSLGGWSPTTPLPQPIGGEFGAADNNYVYTMGGLTGFPAYPIHTVYFAKINQNGTLGNWSQTVSTPSDAHSQAGAAYGDYFYFIGGSDNNSVPTSSVFFASLSGATVISITPEGSISIQ